MLYSYSSLPKNFVAQAHRLPKATSLRSTLLRSTEYGGVAQLGERLNGIQEVIGSIPTVSTKKSRSKERDFFIHCESNGISSTMANLPLLYLISPSGLHIITRQRVLKSFRNDDIQQLTLLMICNFCEIDDIHSFAVMLIVHLVRFASAEHEGHKIGVICVANVIWRILFHFLL